MSIFVSHRRNDTIDFVGRLTNDLRSRFGATEVFVDFEDIHPGEVWPERLRREVGRCRALLAVVGENWVTSRLDDVSGVRRVDQADDWVRQEIAEALQLGKRVIVVLVNDTRPLDEACGLLPPLHKLHERQHLRLRTVDWAHDFAHLVDALERQDEFPRWDFTRYLNWVIDHCGWVDSNPVAGQTGFHPDHWKMEVRYVNLQAEVHQSDGSRVPQDVDEILRGYPRIALLGDQGEGKTTALRHAALGLAKAVLAGDYSKPIPLFLTARILAEYLDRTGNAFPSVTDFHEFWTQESARNQWELPRNAFVDLLNRGNVIVLIDSLDAVAPESGERILRMIRNYIGVHARVRWCITTRPFSWRPNLLPSFGTATMCRLSDVQIRQYLDVWSRYDVTTSARRTATAAADPATSKARLERNILANATLLELARRPLFLMAICVIYSPGSALPSDLSQLFRMICEWLIHSANPHPNRYTNRIRTRAYAHIAFAMCSLPGRGRVPTRQLCNYIRANNTLVKDWDYATIEGFLNAESTAVRLLIEEEDFWRFPHRAFQDYLAARHLVDEDTWKSVVGEHISDPQWEEVFAFVATILVKERRMMSAEQPAADELVRLLLESSSSSSLPDKAKAVVRVLQVFRYVQPDQHSLVSISEYKEMEGKLEAMFDAKEATQFPIEDRYSAAVALGVRGDLRLRGVAPNMVHIEGGEVTIGAQSRELNASNYDGQASPRESVGVVVAGPFELGQYPVTVHEYRRFVDESGYDPIGSRKYWSDEGWSYLEGRTAPKHWEKQLRIPNCPVTGVNYFEAEAYCRWLSDRVDNQWVYRLPTEDEWEFAVRRSDEVYCAYSWGSEPRNLSHIYGYNQLVPVGLFVEDRTASGLRDIACNVSEWTLSDSTTEREEGPRLASRQPPNKRDTLRTIKGGNYRNDTLSNRTAVRGGKQQALGYSNVGFRVLRQPKPVEIKKKSPKFDYPSTLADHFQFCALQARAGSASRNEILSEHDRGFAQEMQRCLEILLPAGSVRGRLLPCCLGDNLEKFQFNLRYQDSRIKLEVESQLREDASEADRQRALELRQRAVACMLAFPLREGEAPVWKGLNDNDLDAIVFQVLNYFNPKRLAELHDAEVHRNEIALAALPSRDSLLAWPFEKVVRYQIFAGIRLLDTAARQLELQFPEACEFGPLMLEEFEQALEQQPRLLFLLDDNGELVWDLALIELLLCRHERMSIVAVVSTEVVGNNVTSGTLNACLDTARFETLKAHPRLHFHREYNPRSCIDPTCASPEFLEHWADADCIYVKGTAAFETLQRLPKQGFYAFVVHSSDSVRCSGYEPGTGVFVAVPPNFSCFDYSDPTCNLRAQLDRNSFQQRAQTKQLSNAQLRRP